MAETFQFDLVSPERRLASVEAKAVQLPGADGDLTAMPDHAPLITTLRPGVVTVTSAEGETRYAVSGGFAEVSGECTSVLAEMALPADEVTDETLQSLMQAASEKRDNASGDELDALAKQVSDIAALAQALGKSVNPI